MRRIDTLVVLSLLALFGPSVSTALGCRYNVRETGFVDLGLERYFLFCSVDSNTSGEAISAREATAERLLRDSRVVFEAVREDGQNEHPALKYFEASSPGCVLVSQDESTRAVSGDDFPSMLRSVTTSPFRETIVERAARSYAVVLVVDGADEASNRRARTAAEAAAESIEQQMRYLPKPIERGPVVLTLPRDSFAGEETLLWSLGIEDTDLGETHAAVLYGRARRIGPVLKGDEIEEQVLYNLLSIVGADCECGLDPRLIRGVGLPVSWGDDNRALVSEELGFDPENPMVKTEVSQILRLRASFYPWASAPRPDPKIVKDDLPVPFVEDTVPDNPVLTMSMYTVAGLAGVVMLVAFLVYRRSSGKSS